MRTLRGGRGDLISGWVFFEPMNEGIWTLKVRAKRPFVYLPMALRWSSCPA